VFARLFGDTLTQMMQGELSAELGYEKYDAQGRNSGNSRNGSYHKTLKTSAGEVEVEVPLFRLTRRSASYCGWPIAILRKSGPCPSRVGS
jgi:hypothetical protein